MSAAGIDYRSEKHSISVIPSGGKLSDPVVFSTLKPIEDCTQSRVTLKSSLREQFTTAEIPPTTIEQNYDLRHNIHERPVT